MLETMHQLAAIEPDIHAVDGFQELVRLVPTGDHAQYGCRWLFRWKMNPEELAAYNVSRTQKKYIEEREMLTI